MELVITKLNLVNVFEQMGTRRASERVGLKKKRNVINFQRKFKRCCHVYLK